MVGRKIVKDAQSWKFSNQSEKEIVEIPSRGGGLLVGRELNATTFLKAEKIRKYLELGAQATSDCCELLAPDNQVFFTQDFGDDLVDLLLVDINFGTMREARLRNRQLIIKLTIVELKLQLADSDPEELGDLALEHRDGLMGFNVSKK
eukprot:c13819_g1_i4.p2 GENE.c13819_g1_i4~~c13819_g1_i4.p2  ORF type:complete len:148 (-),score=30.86 c13819_g1_i4:11-454(-)